MPKMKLTVLWLSSIWYMILFQRQINAEHMQSPRENVIYQVTLDTPEIM